ncbi:MAG: hypothetical protein IIU07_02100, partial [Lachnospiraceae bacterium]|nr:hypothetical protein [Lachnospiraceae bacterium]
APVASKNTADQSGLGGGTNYDDRESKAGADGAADDAAPEAGNLTAGAGDVEAAAAADPAQAAESPAAAEATDTGMVDINQNAEPAAAPAVVLSPEQQVFLANISAGLAGGTMTLEQAAALIGTAGITPEQVDAYMAGTGASAGEQTAADPAAIAADPALTPAADPATSPAADPMAAAGLPGADPMQHPESRQQVPTIQAVTLHRM